MVTIDIVLTRVAGLEREALERWIALAFVSPERRDGGWVFREIDVARTQLIRQLCCEMEVTEAALPVVLSLLDQLYDTRRRLRELGNAIGRTAPAAIRDELLKMLSARDLS